MNSILARARHVRMGNHAVIQNVGGNATTNIFNNDRGDLVDLYGSMFRRFPIGDIIVRRDVSSEVVDVTTTSSSRGSTSGTLESSQTKILKVRKTVQHVGLVGLQGSFTAVTAEAVSSEDQGEFKRIVDRICREMASRQSPLLTHLVGLGWSERLTLILPDELVNGDEFANRGLGEDDWIEWYYLWYTHTTAIDALRSDTTLAVPVSVDWSRWSFNARTHAWKYDIPSVFISPPAQEISLPPIYHLLPPLHQDPHPQLNPVEIAACFENQFGDFLHMLSPMGETRHVDNLRDFVRRGLLTFGAVVDRKKPGILAHFPCTPAPEWSCESVTADVEASYSTLVPSRVDLSFHNTGGLNQVDIHFAFQLPDLFPRRAAYLSQSIGFSEDCDEPYEDLVLIDYVGFSIVGTFPQNPATSPNPAYLFVPPIPVNEIDGAHSISFPLPSKFYHWCSDPNGRNNIPEEHWETYGIPRLQVLAWIGSSWAWREYEIARDYFERKNYNPDGREYAREHGYPELVHDGRSKTKRGRRKGRALPRSDLKRGAGRVKSGNTSREHCGTSALGEEPTPSAPTGSKRKRGNDSGSPVTANKVLKTGQSSTATTLRPSTRTIKKSRVFQL